MVGNRTAGSQTHVALRISIPITCDMQSTYTDPRYTRAVARSWLNAASSRTQQQVAEDERREIQRRAFRRNQVFGLLIIAAAILVWWLFHTNPKWIFPPGWWRP